jgi:hypothetical protein
LVSQRDIVEVPTLDIVDSEAETHPVIILSSTDAINMEEGFVGVMLTSSKKFDDEFTFEIDDRMLTKPMGKYCQARTHLIGFFLTEKVARNRHYNSKIKEDYFKQLIKHINRVTFNLPI